MQTTYWKSFFFFFFSIEFPIQFVFKIIINAKKTWRLGDIGFKIPSKTIGMNKFKHVILIYNNQSLYFILLKYHKQFHI